MSTGSSHLHSQTGQTEWALQGHTTFFKYPSIQATSSLGRAFLPQLLPHLPILSGDVPQTHKGVTAETQHLNGKEQIRISQTGFGYRWVDGMLLVIMVLKAPYAKTTSLLQNSNVYF